MLNKRIIFGLLYSESFFHLSRNFRLQKVGDINWLQDNYAFNETCQYIDELAFFYVNRKYDKNGKKEFFKNINNIRKKIFSPIMIGGGIKCFEDAKLCFDNGADKISINTEFENIDLINKISDIYGAQSISLVLDYKRVNKNFELYSNCGTEKKNINLNNIFLNLQNKNIGEIILHSINRDGTGDGYDLDILEELNINVSKPLLLMGGAGKPENIIEALNKNKISGVVTANLFNFIGNTLKVTRELCQTKKIQIAKLI
ncbi:HisA/HisF-related TIM barrel protein [Candidatus Pelagibacter sp.]|nr:HisA/HisF-related TIM barrel protein [Candidatus Pelagibacter sp.]|tara:strand:+ start:45 stop:818 length:774 start_codon:yes stop_codon:yes gene_type:complete